MNHNLTQEALMLREKTGDWWRDRIFLATAEFLSDPNDFTSAKLKSLLKTYQIQHEFQRGSIEDEHEQVMDFR